MTTRGVRGATTVAADDADVIFAATRALLEEMTARNGIRPEDLAAAFFTLTEDLSAAFPARAARALGWEQVPLLDAREIPVPGSLSRCIRVLLLWNCDIDQAQIVHVYQGEAQALRPDLQAALSSRNEEAFP
ncbi:MAG: chorismate mutase [Anaerolineae bacterium]